MKRKLLLLLSAILICGGLSAQNYSSHFDEPSVTPSTATFTSYVEIDGEIVGLNGEYDDIIEVAAFVGDEIRGKVFLMDNGHVYLSAYLEGSDEVVTFKMYNHANDEGDDYVCLSTYVCSDGDNYGDWGGDESKLQFTTPQEEDEEIPYPWTPTSSTQGANTATGTFELRLNGQMVTDDTYTLGLFHGTECRALDSTLRNFPPTQKNVWEMSCIGTTGDTLTFLLYDRVNHRYFRGSCDAYIIWAEGGVSGSARNPFIVDFIAPYVFEGTEDNSWNTTNNWREPAVGLPSETDEVTIDGVCELDQNVTVKNIIVNDSKSLKVLAGKTLTLTEGFTTTDASQLVLVDDAQLNDAARTAGKASYMKTVESWNTNDNNWYLIGSPVGNVTISDTDFPSTESDYDLYWYDETNQTHEEWRNYKQNQTFSFIPGRGYLYANESDCTPSIPGAISYGNVSYEMTYTDRTYDNLDGLNLLGNPYPFAITMENFSNDKLSDGFYLLENGAWSSQSSSTEIPTGQAFLLGCTEANTVTFTPNSAKSRGANRSSIKVNIANSNYADHAFIILGEGNDLVKIAHRNNNIPEVYVPKSSESYAIAHFNKGTESVAVAYHPTTLGQQTLSVELEGSYEYMTLTDNQTGAVVNLLTTPTYTFNAGNNDLAIRFTLRFKANTSVNESEIINPISYLSNGQLSINGLEGQSELQIIDMLGRTVSSSTIKGNYSQVLNMTAGVYVVRVINGTNTYTQKIVVK